MMVAKTKHANLFLVPVGAAGNETSHALEGKMDIVRKAFQKGDTTIAAEGPKFTPVMIKHSFVMILMAVNDRQCSAMT